MKPFAVNGKAGTIVVVDTHNNCVRSIDGDGVVGTLAGSGFGLKDGVGSSAQVRIRHVRCPRPWAALAGTLTVCLCAALPFLLVPL